MVFITSPIVLVLLICIIALHAVNVFLENKWGKIAVFVNLALHIALFPALFFVSAPLSEVVLLFVFSFTAYVIMYFVKVKCKGGDNR